MIKKRRTHRKFSERLTDEQLLDLLDIARYTPNHQFRYPFRFIVINSDTEFYVMMDKIRLGNYKIPPYLLEIEANGKIPSFVAVIVNKDCNEKRYLEDVLANGALIQNIHLQATKLGYSLVWRSLFVNNDFPKEYGISENELVTGFLNIGIPDEEPKPIDYESIKLNIKFANEIN